MPRNTDRTLKRDIRARMAATGENYTTARRTILAATDADPQPAPAAAPVKDAGRDEDYEPAMCPNCGGRGFVETVESGARCTECMGDGTVRGALRCVTLVEHGETITRSVSEIMDSPYSQTSAWLALEEIARDGVGEDLDSGEQWDGEPREVLEQMLAYWNEHPEMHDPAASGFAAPAGADLWVTAGEILPLLERVAPQVMPALHDQAGFVLDAYETAGENQLPESAVSDFIDGPLRNAADAAERDLDDALQVAGGRGVDLAEDLDRIRYWQMVIDVTSR